MTAPWIPRKRSCTPPCKACVPTKSCGDGTIQPPEKCDDGKAVNGTAASKCDASCRFKCGNATLDPGEPCDNGVNDGSYGSYGTCTSTCKLAGYCGDGIMNGNEQCDKRAANMPVSTAYGTGVCTKACLAAPFCGDGRVQSPQEDCEGNELCSSCHSTVPK